MNYYDEVCRQLEKQRTMMTDMMNHICQVLQSQNNAINDQTMAILEQTKSLNRIASALEKLSSNTDKTTFK